jgi:hypothetical protein
MNFFAVFPDGIVWINDREGGGDVQAGVPEHVGVCLETQLGLTARSLSIRRHRDATCFAHAVTWARLPSK